MNLPHIRFNSHDINFKKPFGAVGCNKTINISIEISKDFYADKIILHIDNEINNNIFPLEEKMSFSHGDDNFEYYNCILTSSSIPCLAFYYFEIVKDNTSFYYGNNKDGLGGLGEIYTSSPIPFQITVYSNKTKVPNWFKHSIIYQIFVDRFFNGNNDGKISSPKQNSFIYATWEDSPMYIKDSTTHDIIRWDFFGGNLKGIIKKLDYLKTLGISVIYLNPIFESSSNHKYDTGDYMKIDGMFGDESIFKTLILEAKKRNIYIILDGVFNHAGADSLYFNKYNNYPTIGAYQSKESPYYSWFKFKAYPEDYDCWWGVKSLPCINEEDSSYVNFIIKNKDSVIKHWMKTGIKGWRLDVADELPDKFIMSIKETSKKVDTESVIIGEVWEDASNKISYSNRRKYFTDGTLDSVTNYPLREVMLKFLNKESSSKDLYNKLMSLYENYPAENFYSLVNVIGTHDVERIFTMMKIYSKENIDLSYNYLKIITLIQMTLPGVPLIYYGDEAGLEGLKDPYNRAPYPWEREDITILNWYKRIIKIRNNLPVMRTGDFKPFYFNEDVFGFIRQINNDLDIFNEANETSIAVVIINRNQEKKYNISLTLPINPFSQFTDLINNYTIYKQNNVISMEVSPLQTSIFLGIKP